MMHQPASSLKSKGIQRKKSKEIIKREIIDKKQKAACVVKPSFIRWRRRYLTRKDKTINISTLNSQQKHVVLMSIILCFLRVDNMHPVRDTTSCM